MPRLSFGLLAALLAIGSASPGRAAVPVPPEQVAYSGVLVDGGGVPLAGPVDLTARHYTMNLGPAGVATDSPTNPLTTNLRTGLTGDLAAGAGRFVEITVNTDAPLARVALV